MLSSTLGELISNAGAVVPTERRLQLKWIQLERLHYLGEGQYFEAAIADLRDFPVESFDDTFVQFGSLRQNPFELNVEAGTCSVLNVVLEEDITRVSMIISPRIRGKLDHVPLGRQFLHVARNSARLPMRHHHHSVVALGEVVHVGHAHVR